LWHLYAARTSLPPRRPLLKFRKLAKLHGIDLFLTIFFIISGSF
jgi:hypothetical protein